jgi:hypothetical protein
MSGIITCHRCGKDTPSSETGIVVCMDCGTQIQPRSLDAIRLVLDANIYDHLIATPEIQQAAIAAHQNGHVEFLMTSIQLDQITAVPDSDRRKAMVAIPFVITPTYGFVLGLSKLGLARFGESEQLEVVRGDQGNHTEDALLATTAKYEEAILVTEDKRLEKRAGELARMFR